MVGYRAETSEVAALLRMFRSLRRIYDLELRAINVLLGGRGDPSDVVIAKLRGGLLQITDATLRERVKDVTVALSTMAKTMQAIQEHHERLVGSLDDVQIKAVLRQEFQKAAHTFTPAEWQLLDNVRAIQAKDGQKAAFIANRNGLRAVGRQAMPELAELNDDTEDDDA